MEERTALTDAEAACFEAGIKFGSLYHQFAGTPVSPESTDSLERAMEAAIENQPYCERVSVDIDTAAIRDTLDGESHEYTELTGRFLEVTIVVEYDQTVAIAEMSMDDGYPLMSIERIRQQE